MSNADPDRTAQQYARFLNHLPADQRGPIGSLFHEAVRAGATDAAGVLSHVQGEVMALLQTRYLSQSRRGGLEALRAALASDPAAARDYAEYALWWNGLPQSERDRLKSEKEREGQREWMRSQPPTSKQISFLRALGCDTTPASKLEASELIDQFQRGGRR